MTKCEYCGEILEYIPYKCKNCGLYYCMNHRLPENHDCSYELNPIINDQSHTTKNERVYDKFPDNQKNSTNPAGKNDQQSAYY